MHIARKCAAFVSAAVAVAAAAPSPASIRYVPQALHPKLFAGHWRDEWLADGFRKANSLKQLYKQTKKRDTLTGNPPEGSRRVEEHLDRARAGTGDAWRQH